MKNGLGIPFLQIPRNRFYSLKDLRSDKRRAHSFYCWLENRVQLHNAMSNYSSLIKNHFSV